MTFSVERLIKFLETFPKDSKVCFKIETEKVEVFPNVFEGGNIKDLEIRDIQEQEENINIYVK